MTKYDRVMAALEYRPADRPPVVGGFVRHPAFLAEIARVDVETFWQAPRQVAIKAFHRLGADCIIELILPDRDNPSGGAKATSGASRFDSPESVAAWAENYPEPQVDAARLYDQLTARWCNGQREMGDMVYLPNSFRSAPQFQWEEHLGAENYYMAIALYPEAMKRMFDREGKRARLENEVLVRVLRDNHLPPYIWCGQDSCDDRGAIAGVAAMEQLYFPALKHAFEPLVNARVRVIWHSDGNITPIVPHLLNCGVEGFQGMQENVGHAVDIQWLCDQTTMSGRKPVLVGSVSSTTTLPFGTPEDVRRGVRRCKEFARKRGGGVLINSSSSVGPEVPVENLRAMFDEARTKSRETNNEDYRYASADSGDPTERPVAAQHWRPPGLLSADHPGTDHR